MNPATLQELFPDADYGFSMRLRPGNPADFFAPTAESSGILRERCSWLAQAPTKYSVLDPGYEVLVNPLLQFANAARAGSANSTDEVATPAERLRQLGGEWEPDFMIVAPDDRGRFVLRAGCVCFPSGWALEEKLGLPIEEIHGVVPGLNAAVGAKIHQFLTRLKPGIGWYRSNWGISSSAEFNQHPSRAINQLTKDTSPASTWLRIEHQVLTSLPGSNAILFGIRLENVALAQMKEDVAIRGGLRHALATMPDAMAAYKNLTALRPALLDYLG